MTGLVAAAVPKLPLAPWLDAGLDWLTETFSPVTRAVSGATETIIEAIEDGLLWLPPWVVIAAFVGAALAVAGWRVALAAAAGLGLIWNLRLWEPTMETLTLVAVATTVAVIAGVPIGIWAAVSTWGRRLTMPVLDFMQTMPAFVYLIPAIPFFGIGKVSAIVATVIFAMPPAIRLTVLGIDQVPADLVEAADAFGATRRQRLFKVQLPVAVPTIMAGVNQTIMLALSMVVIAGMIGAKGLGNEVWKAIQRLNAGDGFEAGLAVVILAMILDRLSQALGRRGPAAARPG